MKIASLGLALEAMLQAMINEPSVPPSDDKVSLIPVDDDALEEAVGGTDPYAWALVVD